MSAALDRPLTITRSPAETLLLPVLGVILALVFVVSLGIGPAAIGPLDALAALVGGASEGTRLIVWE